MNDTKKKVNCWEVIECSKKTEKGEPCPTTIVFECEGLNKGKMGGRICWSVAGTFNSQAVTCCEAKKRASCLTCDFFKQVMCEEGDNFTVFLPAGEMEKLRQRLKKPEQQKK